MTGSWSVVLGGRLEKLWTLLTKNQEVYFRHSQMAEVAPGSRDVALWLESLKHRGDMAFLFQCGVAIESSSSKPGGTRDASEEMFET